MKARLLLVPILLGGLMACSSASDAAGDACPEWPVYATPREALEAADYVITADITKRVGDEAIFGTAAHAYSVSTKGLPVLKGEDVGHTDLKVISAPQKCSGGDPYPDGDPLREGRRVILFLTREDPKGPWRTITPDHGVLPADGGSSLPDRWPS
ncbi:hypothetical protein [Streptomyces sp. NRRL F-4474]|uniref:hypothetical protein n=1 Tax=Streptomyces sp. NRRL F-4474 TaxID=1463851 RepID=UPI0004CAA17E|nr:hypothetical protein [Streptomyces sp. NRRL F-4474]